MNVYAEMKENGILSLLFIVCIGNIFVIKCIYRE